MNRKQGTLLNSSRGRALVHALTLEAVSGPKVFQRAGLRDAVNSDGWHQNYRVLSTLVSLGLASKTGPDGSRSYALTRAGLDRCVATRTPDIWPAGPVCRLCGRAGGHWSGCLLWKAVPLELPI
ncbi:hypothetical protein GCM10022631_01950 [Deinococcus rubellus]|uniref:Transcriptional regulator n=1 Tax=Deinococcus rubellus TaxID=1889240 RepID=A0ABY5YKA3_9DEIO|nr:hypothetical protein [Deinococcus rubellus]UWX64777.1 hypothetical protein N0D28_03700 [Deinococcus rubellus]